MTSIPVSSTMTYAKWPTKDSMVPQANADESLASQLEFIQDPARSAEELLTYLMCSNSVQQDFSKWVSSWMPRDDSAEGLDVEKLRSTARVLHAMSSALVAHRPIAVDRPAVS